MRNDICDDFHDLSPEQKKSLGGAARENAMNFLSLPCNVLVCIFAMWSEDSSEVKAGKGARLASRPFLLLVHLPRQGTTTTINILS